jgi:septum formation protein
MPELVLASSSPRRKELLTQIGVKFSVQTVDIDESVLPEEVPEHYVCRLAAEKALAGWHLLNQPDTKVVLGSDTTVVIDNQILGKPENKADAVKMLMLLSGRMHQVMTAVSLCYQGKVETTLVTTEVLFKVLDEDVCQRYWDTGEPRDKAGGYGIQGLGAVFVERIEGSYTGVVGLPLAETAELLKKFDIQIWQK